MTSKMKMFQYKHLNIGFLVLCPDKNVFSMRSTVKSIQSRYPNAKLLAVAPLDVHEEDLMEMERLCPVIVGNNTITSLINAGMNASKSDWTITVIAGSYVKDNIDKKYCYFVTNEKDILFPIVDGRTDFVDGTLNGLMIHKNAWKDAGEFSNESSLGICKLMWCLSAMESGCVFKAIMAAKIV